MKNKIILLLIILVIITGIVIGIKVLTENEYTKKDAITLISPLVTKNMYLKRTSTDLSNNSVLINEYYIKDNISYEKTYLNSAITNEKLSDFNNNFVIDIAHTTKNINKFLIDKNDNIFDDVEISLKFYEDLLNNANNYKYLGKQNLNDIEIIKFSFKSTSDSNIIYYVDINSKHIVKVESYDSNNNLILTDEYTYKYDTILDSDILSYDETVYTDYTFTDNTID